MIGRSASDEELAETRRAIEENPRGYIAQEVVELSTHPTFVGDKLAARHIDLRPFIVTGESVSMLTEACATRRPVYIFDPGNHPVALHCSGVGKQTSLTDTRRWWQRAENYRWRPLTHLLAQKIGPSRMRRDVAVMQRHLIDNRRAVWLGQRFPQSRELPELEDLQRAVARVKALF